MSRALAVLLLFLGSALAPVPVAASEERVVVTGVQFDASGRAEITLNGCLVIKDVEVSKAGDRVQVRLPEYVSRKKRVYPQVVLLTRQARDAVHQALLRGAPGTEQSPGTAFSVTRFSPLKKRSNLKVIAAVAFNGAVEVTCKILEGRNGPWIAWPERRGSERGQWFRQVEIADKRLRESVEQELLDRYASLQDEEGGGGDE